MTDVKTWNVVGVKNTSMNLPGSTAEPVWMVELAEDGGDPTYAIAFVHSTFSWRIAEYGIDPADVDTLMDIALHEPNIMLQHTDPTFLYNTHEETAREAHLARVSASKGKVVYLDPNNLLDEIRRSHDPHDPVHAVRAARVRAVRATTLKMRGKSSG